MNPFENTVALVKGEDGRDYRVIRGTSSRPLPLPEPLGKPEASPEGAP